MKFHKQSFVVVLDPLGSIESIKRFDSRLHNASGLLKLKVLHVITLGTNWAILSFGK